MSFESRVTPPPVPHATAPNAARRHGRVVLYGFGRDNDGHLRLTTGPGYCLAGGSDATHRAMAEHARRCLDEILRRGYRIDRLTREEAAEIARLVEDESAMPT